MADAWVCWLELAAAVLLLAAPTMLTLRRAGRRRLPLLGPGGVRPPWWAGFLLFLGFVLFGYGARGLADDDGDLLKYCLGAGAVSLALQLGLVVRHNRRIEASPGAGRSENAGGAA